MIDTFHYTLVSDDVCETKLPFQACREPRARARTRDRARRGPRPPRARATRSIRDVSESQNVSE